MTEFKYEVKRKIGAIEKDIELRVVSWGGYPESYDLRKWYTSNGEERCAKGITFSEDVGKELTKQLSNFLTGAKVDGITRGKYTLKVQKTKYGYDVATWNGSYRMKGVTFTEDGLKKLWEVMYKEFISEILDEQRVEAPKKSVTPKTDMDPVVHSLTSIPVNDGNYPLNKATIDQIREAIAYMEANPNGQKTRLTRCKTKLKQLEKAEKVEEKPVVEEPVEEETETEDVEETEDVTEEDEAEEVTKPEIKNVAKETAKPVQKKADIIQFPKADNTPIKKLAPTGENHSFEEVEKKLGEELKLFKNDPDSTYVINGVLKACAKDQELLDNVMRPEKSYKGAIQYFFNKAKEGYCTRIGNVGIMSAETALKYAIDYFNSEDKKAEPKKNTKKVDKPEETEEPKETVKKSAPRRKKSTWKRGGNRR